jgi:hypothetical protein
VLVREQDVGAYSAVTMKGSKMKLKLMLLYMKYRRYLIPAAVVLVLLIAAFAFWPR